MSGFIDQDGFRAAPCSHMCSEGKTCPHRHGTPTVRRYPRTTGEAFRDADYSTPFEPHIPLPLWQRIAHFLRRRFA